MTGKQRGGVPVRTDSEEDRVKERGVAPGVGERTEEASVPVRRLRPWPELSEHAMDAATRDRHPGEERAPRRAEVALRIVGRNAALVRKEHLRLRPREAGSVRVGQHRVERQGRSAAGDHPAEAAVSPNGRGGVVRQFARERRAGPLEIPEDSNASTYP